MLLYALLAVTAAASTSKYTAIVGETPGKFAVVDQLTHFLTTDWRLIVATNATTADVESAQAFVQTPVDMLGTAKAGSLYQYAFTGYDVTELPKIPRCACCLLYSITNAPRSHCCRRSPGNPA